MSHGSDESENYWPGYVDALTSMIQVLAFVMLMLAMAVFVLSQSVSKHAVEAIANAVNADVKPNADIKQLTQAVMDRLQQLGSAAPVSASNRPEFSARGPSFARRFSRRRRCAPARKARSRSDPPCRQRLHVRLPQGCSSGNSEGSAPSRTVGAKPLKVMKLCIFAGERRRAPKPREIARLRNTPLPAVQHDQMSTRDAFSRPAGACASRRRRCYTNALASALGSRNPATCHPPLRTTLSAGPVSCWSL